MQQQHNPLAMGERLIFQDALVTVTTTRAVMAGTTYAMANITSVKSTVEPAQIGCATVLALGGIVIGAIMAANDSALGWLFMLGALPFAVWAYLNRKSKYWVRIGTAGSEMNAVWSYDKAWTAKVVVALSEAIIARG